MAMRKKTQAASELVIPPQKKLQFEVFIGGEDISGGMVVVHQFSEKARAEIRDKQLQHAKPARGPRIPMDEYVCSKYVDETGLWEGLPCAGFRRAIIDAASYVAGITKVSLRGSVFIKAEGHTLDGLNILPILTASGKADFREDVVRLPTGSADLRYRSSYTNWGAKLVVVIDPDIISAEQVHHLIERAGFSVGICEARPQKSGEWGQFKLITEAQFKKLKPVKVTKQEFEVLRTQMGKRNFGGLQNNSGRMHVAGKPSKAA